MAKVKMKHEEPVEEVVIEESAKEQKVAKSLVAKVTGCAQLRLRSEASTNSEVLQLIPEETVLTILNRIDDEWSRVSLENGTTGFVMNKFIR